MTAEDINCRVWVGNIAKSTKVDDVKAALAEYGKILDFKFIPKPGMSFAFVQYGTEDEANRAMKMANRMTIGDSELSVKSANPQRSGEKEDNDRRDAPSRSSFYGNEDSSSNRRNRSRSRERKKMYKVEIQNLPHDMTWQELKRLGSDYGKSLEYTRVWSEKDSATGVLEFSEKRDATKVIDSLHGKRMEDSERRLKVFLDDSDEEVVRRKVSPRRDRR
jgi:RNA recognition motif-containing protein